MRLYISGPMTDMPNHNYLAFNEAAKQLREAGYEVLNPAELDLIFFIGTRYKTHCTGSFHK